MPQADAETPGPPAATHDERHAIHVMTACRQGVKKSDEMAERPDPSPMGMSAEHERAGRRLAG